MKSDVFWIAFIMSAFSIYQKTIIKIKINGGALKCNLTFLMVLIWFECHPKEKKKKSFVALYNILFYNKISFLLKQNLYEISFIIVKLSRHLAFPIYYS